MLRLKKYILSKPILLSIVAFVYNLNSILRINSNPNNELKYSKAFLRKTNIVAKRKNNKILIMKGSYLNNCSIMIYGENNKVVIKEDCRLQDVEIHIEDNYNEIVIGRNTTIAGITHLACIEGSKIIIGDDCMFSKDIVFRTGDSHSIVNDVGVRINPSLDIRIGNHVWVANKVIVTKGVRVNDNSIIGTGSIVTNSFEEPNIIIAGVPAKKVKERINWLKERI